MSLRYQFQPIDVTIEGHPKAWAAGIEAMGLWLWGMVHAKAHKTKGRMHRASVLGAWGGKRNIMLAKRLVDAGLWVLRADGDWDIFNFDSKSAGSVEKGTSTDRVKRFRDRSKSVSETHETDHETRFTETSASYSNSVSSSVSLPDLASEPPEEATGIRARVVGPDGECGALFAAWTEGIREATGIPQSGLAPSDRRELVAIANTHAGGATGQALLEWVRVTAIAFAKVHDPTFGGFVPLQARKWLDGGRRQRARTGPIVQSADNRAWKLPEGFE